MEPHRKVTEEEEEEEEIGCPSLSSSSNYMDDEDEDDGDDGDDASSPLPPLSSSSSSSSSPLFGMSKLMAELPIKRGLSRHFNGKSQSFKSLSKVERLEDLVKPCKRLEVAKLCRRSYGGGGLDVRDRIITKKRNGKPHFGVEGGKAIHGLGSGSFTNGTLLYA